MYISLCCLTWDILFNVDRSDEQAHTVNTSSDEYDARQNMQIN